MRSPLVGALALALLAPALAGCTAETGPPCTPKAASPGGQGVCFVTADGWVIQGVVWNPNATDAPSALLVHGFREQHGQMDPLALALAEHGLRVLAIDLRGHGASTTNTQGPDRSAERFRGAEIQAMLHDLNASQAYLGEAPDAIVGASLSANLALAHAAEHPAVDTLVLLSPIPARGPLEPAAANEAYHGSVLYIASEQDRPAAQTARDLHAGHEGAPAELTIDNGSAHGSQHLDNATRLADVRTWVLGHVTAGDGAEGEVGR